jgi:hypothetical protein
LIECSLAANVSSTSVFSLALFRIERSIKAISLCLIF